MTPKGLFEINWPLKKEMETTKKETVAAKSGELSRSFTFNWSEEVDEEEKELQKRRKKD